MVRFFFASTIVVGLGAAILFWLVRSHTDRIVLAHSEALSEQILQAAYASRHIDDVFEGDPMRFLQFGPFSRPAFAPLLVKYIFLDDGGDFIIAKDAPTQDVIYTPRGFHTQDQLQASFHLALNGQSVPELVEYTPIRGTAGMYAQTVHVINDSTGETRGGLVLLLDVGELEVAYKSGMTMFAALVTLLGCVLCGVPSAAFIVQRAYTSQSQKDARYLAQHDSLTGLLNRGAFLDMANRYAASRELVGIAYIDVDRFKSVNDTQGHAAGDMVLAELAQVMRDVFRQGALLARLGGDEFVIGFSQNPNVHTPDEPQSALHVLRERFTRRTLDASIGMPVSISIGYAAAAKGMTVEDVMAQADLALYTAKMSGRDGVAVYSTEMGRALKRRQFVENLLQTGMEEDRFILHYQPLVGAADNRVVGYEALLRLRGPQGEMVSPTEFVPIAENLGLITKIGAWVLYTATRDVAQLDGSPFVAINLSVEQFRAGDIVSVVKDALEHAELAPNRLELEVTETLLIDDQHSVALQIDALKDLGVSVAMDDFGTGFSSLSYLWKYGFDRIKIDRSFVHALEVNHERSIELIESIVLLGARLGMNVTAEGIEHREQAELLSKLGCDVLQGFYFGRPAPLKNGAPSVAQSKREV